MVLVSPRSGMVADGGHLGHACESYHLDMTAPRFGDCVCGKPKAAHGQVSDLHERGRPARRVHSMGAQLALNPLSMLQPGGRPRTMTTAPACIRDSESGTSEVNAAGSSSHVRPLASQQLTVNDFVVLGRPKRAAALRSRHPRSLAAPTISDAIKKEFTETSPTVGDTALAEPAVAQASTVPIERVDEAAPTNAAAVAKASAAQAATAAEIAAAARLGDIIRSIGAVTEYEEERIDIISVRTNKARKNKPPDSSGKGGKSKKKKKKQKVAAESAAVI